MSWKPPRMRQGMPGGGGSGGGGSGGGGRGGSGRRGGGRRGDGRGYGSGKGSSGRGYGNRNERNWKTSQQQGNYRHGGRNAERGRRQGGKRKNQPKLKPPPSKKALIKDIREACEKFKNKERVDSAITRARYYSLRLDSKTLQLILEGLAKIGANTTVEQMQSVIGLRDHNCYLKPAGIHKILLNLPQCSGITPTNAAKIVNLCLSVSSFCRGKQAKEYFRTRARWCVLEFFGEAKAVLENIVRQDPNILAMQGKSVIGASAERAIKSSEILFRGGNNGGGQARRELSTGDSVRVSRYYPSVPSTTTASATTVPNTTSIHVPIKTDEEVYEGEVTVEHPLIIKFIDSSASTNILALSGDKSGSSLLLSSSVAATRTAKNITTPENPVAPLVWRIDKMANRVSFTREMSALTILTTNSDDDTISFGNAGSGTKGRPNNNIVRAIVESINAPDIHNVVTNSISKTNSTNTIITKNTSNSSSASSIISRKLGDAVLHGKELADICAIPCEHPVTGRPIQGTGIRHSYANTGLNESQRRALAAATERSLTLVQGPPGTGKTAVALRVLTHWARSRQLNAGRDMSLLACSDSNVAVDNMVEGLVKAGIRVVRLGRPENTRPELIQYSTFAMVEDRMKTNGNDSFMSQKETREAKHHALTGVLNSAQVICATCVGAGSGMLEKKRFAGVLIDEASQATEIATIVPLLHHCQQLVLVGDHCQLPPTVASEDAQFEGCSLSLFERLVNSGVPPLLLDTQYRMHPAISQFPSDCFYGGHIADGITAADRLPARGFHWPRPTFPVAFIPVENGQEHMEAQSKANYQEAQVVANLVQGFVAAGIPLLEIGVTTPYSAQVRLLRQMMGVRLRTIECSSVDAFQGREKTVMIISTVRANRHGNVGFLADWCRTNVALTRARNGMIVVGHPVTLSSDQRSWGPFLRWAWAMGCCVGQSAPGGEYDQIGTRKLATGKKEFLEKQKKRMMEKRGGGSSSIDGDSVVMGRKRGREKEDGDVATMKNIKKDDVTGKRRKLEKKKKEERKGKEKEKAKETKKRTEGGRNLVSFSSDSSCSSEEDNDENSGKQASLPSVETPLLPPPTLPPPTLPPPTLPPPTLPPLTLTNNFKRTPLPPQNQVFPHGGPRDGYESRQRW
jgi:hypothetical protein